MKKMRDFARSKIASITRKEITAQDLVKALNVIVLLAYKYHIFSQSASHFLTVRGANKIACKISNQSSICFFGGGRLTIKSIKICLYTFLLCFHKSDKNFRVVKLPLDTASKKMFLRKSTDLKVSTV